MLKEITELNNTLKTITQHNKIINIVFIILFLAFAILHLTIINKETDNKIIYQYDLKIMCSRDFYDCSNFIARDYVEMVYYYCYSIKNKDVHHLDKNGNGVPCESIKRPKY